MNKLKMCIVGGAGHVGLPLAIVFAKNGLSVLIYDQNEEALREIEKGKVPFMESGAKPLLADVLKQKSLRTTSSPEGLSGSDVVVITIGTPVDEFMNPDTKVMKKCVDDILPFLRSGQLVVLRSTVYPGTTEWLGNYFKLKKKNVKLAFCPERVVQGKAIEELQKLPQIVSGLTAIAEKEAVELFQKIAPSVVRLSPLEAEFSKLFSNAYRYIQFAIANQFFMMANSAGVDYSRILDGMKKDYSRAVDIPGAGFAAGPCLLKDTMQLAAFSDNRFSLGHTAMVINEGLVLYLVNQLKKKYPLKKMTVGLLGMAFKANNDDTRSSLSYKLKQVLSFTAKEVLTTDPYVTTDSHLRPLKEVITQSDLLILCAPHKDYAGLKLGGKVLVDIWGFFGKGTLV